MPRNKNPNHIPNANIKSVTFKGGKMNVEGTFPQKVEIK